MVLSTGFSLFVLVSNTDGKSFINTDGKSFINTDGKSFINKKKNIVLSMSPCLSPKVY